MKINNYIKILSAILIMFGYSNNGYSTVVQQPVQNNAYGGVVQGTKLVQQLNTLDDFLKSDDSEVDQSFRQKQNEEKKALLMKFCDITAGMDKAFHLNKHKTQNNILKEYINIFLEFQFIHPVCNAEFAKMYSEAVKDLKEQLTKYYNGCKELIEQYSVSNLVKQQYYKTRYNVQELEKLLKSITDFSSALDNSISTLYPNIATQPVQNAVVPTQQQVQPVQNTGTPAQQSVPYANLVQGMKPVVQNAVAQVQ